MGEDPGFLLGSINRLVHPFTDANHRQVLSEDLDLLVSAFLKRLHDFQQRAKERDIVKARMKKR